MDYQGRISAEHITTLEKDEVFVFGSNKQGKHGKGAALTAKKKFGAKEGRGAGMQGRSYGIPTKHRPTMQKKDRMDLDEIAWYVDKFIEFTKLNPQLTFLVTKIGCGLSRYHPNQVAPLFEEALDLENVHLPLCFWEALDIDEIQP